MRHTLSYRGRLTSSNAQVALVRANFTAGRGDAWEGGRAPRPGIEASRGGLQATAKIEALLKNQCANYPS